MKRTAKIWQRPAAKHFKWGYYVRGRISGGVASTRQKAIDAARELGGKL